MLPSSLCVRQSCEVDLDHVVFFQLDQEFFPLLSPIFTVTCIILCNVHCACAIRFVHTASSNHAAEKLVCDKHVGRSLHITSSDPTCAQNLRPAYNSYGF